VAAIGHGMGTTWTYTTGMVSNTYPVDGFADKPLFQTQIPLNPGNSGGPIFDRNGVVVGVVTAGIQKAQSINFAIRSSEALRRFARLAGPRPPASSVAPAALTVIAPEGAPVFVDGASVGKGPRVTAAVSPGEHEALAIIGGAAVRQRVTFPGTASVELKAP
jgi:serine protease Do